MLNPTFKRTIVGAALLAALAASGPARAADETVDAIATVVGGAGMGIDSTGVGQSPELGVKFGHGFGQGTRWVDPSLHLLTRADVAPTSGHVRAWTILLGWTFI